MSEFFERIPIPKRKLVFYGVLAAASIAGLGLYIDERTLIIAAAVFGVVIAGFGVVLDAARTNTRLQWQKIGRWLLYVGLLIVILLKLWDLLPK